MGTIKEVTVFTNGDSSVRSTWSNVPFFFSETLISKGIKVNRVDLTPSPLLDRLYRLTWERTIRVISSDTTYTYFRSLIHFLDARLRIKEALNKFDNSEMNIFLTFSFSSVGMTKRPTVLPSNSSLARTSWAAFESIAVSWKPSSAARRLRLCKRRSR